MEQTKQKIEIRWIQQRIAKEFLSLHHRKLKNFVGAIFCVGLYHEKKLIAVCVVGRPSSSFVDFHEVLEVTRTGTIPNRFYAVSRLYSRIATLAKAFGFKRVQTYTDDSESGISLKAANWTKAAAGRGQQRNKTLWIRHL